MSCRVECSHGVCVSGSCACDEGWAQVIGWDVGNPGDERVAPCDAKKEVIMGMWWTVLVLAALNGVHRIYYVLVPGGGRRLKEYIRPLLEPLNDVLALALALDHLIHGHKLGFDLFQTALLGGYGCTFMAMVEIQNQKNIILLNKESKAGLPQLRTVTQVVKFLHRFALICPSFLGLVQIIAMALVEKANRISIYRGGWTMIWICWVLNMASNAFAFRHMILTLKTFRQLSIESNMDTDKIDTAINNWEIFLKSIYGAVPFTALVGACVLVEQWFRFLKYVTPAGLALLAFLKLVVAHSLMESSLRLDREETRKTRMFQGEVGAVRTHLGVVGAVGSLSSASVAPDLYSSPQ